MARLTAALALCAALVACTPPPPPAPPIDATKFAALRETAAAMPASGATTVTEADLTAAIKAMTAALKALPTETLNTSEQQVHAAYADVLEGYVFARDLWAERTRRQASRAGGDRVPVQIGTLKLDAFWVDAVKYKLPISDETLPDGVQLKVLPSDAHERVWKAAEAARAKADGMLSAK